MELLTAVPAEVDLSMQIESARFVQTLLLLNSSYLEAPAGLPPAVARVRVRLVPTVCRG